MTAIIISSKRHLRFLILVSTAFMPNYSFSNPFTGQYRSVEECLYDRNDPDNAMYFQTCAVHYFNDEPEADNTQYHKCLRAAYDSRKSTCKSKVRN